MLQKRLFAIVSRVLCPALLVALAAGCAGGGGGSGVTPPAVFGQGAKTTDQASYVTTVLNDGPTAYYHLDDTGSSAADSSGNAINGAVGSQVSQGAAGLVQSSTDTAIDVPGVRSSSGIVLIPATAKLQPSTAVSVEGFIRFTTVPASWTVPLAYGADNDSNVAAYEWYFYNGKLYAQFHTTSGTAIVASSAALSANTTYHVVTTFDGSKASLYINGVLSGSMSKSGALTGYRLGLGIGDDAGNSDPAFKGTIDEVAIYAGKALTQAQVASHYDAATGSGLAQAPPTSAPTAAPSAAPSTKPTSAPTTKPDIGSAVETSLASAESTYTGSYRQPDCAAFLIGERGVPFTDARSLQRETITMHR